MLAGTGICSLPYPCSVDSLRERGKARADHAARASYYIKCVGLWIYVLEVTATLWSDC